MSAGDLLDPATAARVRAAAAQERKDREALLDAARAVVAAFRVPLESGHYRGPCATSLRLLEASLTSFEGPRQSTTLAGSIEGRPTETPWSDLPRGPRESNTFAGSPRPPVADQCSSARPAAVEIPREGGGQGGTPREGSIALSSGGAYSSHARAAADLVIGDRRSGIAFGPAVAQ